MSNSTARSLVFVHPQGGMLAARGRPPGPTCAPGEFAPPNVHLPLPHHCGVAHTRRRHARHAMPASCATHSRRALQSAWWPGKARARAQERHPAAVCQVARLPPSVPAGTDWHPSPSAHRMCARPRTKGQVLESRTSRRHGYCQPPTRHLQGQPKSGKSVPCTHTPGLGSGVLPHAARPDRLSFGVNHVKAVAGLRRQAGHTGAHRTLGALPEPSKGWSGSLGCLGCLGRPHRQGEQDEACRQRASLPSSSPSHTLCFSVYSHTYLRIAVWARLD